MNIWVEKSFKLARKNGYLDRISEVYPIDISDIEDNVTQNDEYQIKELLRKKDKKGLILFLVKMKKFPFDEPYIGFIRIFNDAIDKNPKTIDRIFERLETLGLEEIINGINRPKSASRKFGSYFSKWLRKKYRSTSNFEEFLKSEDKLIILNAGDSNLRKFARKYLDFDRKKGLDFIFKVNKNYVIGETKFVSANGGTQDKSVREVLSMVKGKTSKATIISILDGVPWVGTSELYKSLHDLNKDQNIMSLLLLDDFLKTLC